jgi:hypothetical protein
MRVLCCLVAGLALCSAEKLPPVSEAANDRVQITATLYRDKDEIRQLLGSDLGGYFYVVKIEVAPKAEALKVDRDDFLLRSYKDGQKSGPFAPSQIAGRGALVLSASGGGAGGVMSEDRGPVWGGAPGTGGRPHKLGGEGTSAGNVGVDGPPTASMRSDKKEDPLLRVLKDKELPAKETREPVSGLLYFSLEGKHKPKDLELQYRGAGGKLNLEFK